MHLLLLLALPAAGASPRPAPRPAPLHLAATDTAWGYELSVKLRDGARGRMATGGALRSEAGVDLSALQRWLADAGARAEPLLALEPARLEALRDRARARTGVEPADLQGMLRVVGPREPQALLALGERLRQHPQVEYAWLRPVGLPPPGDIGSPTPDFSDRQGYLDAAPGVDAWGAWAEGLTGSRVELRDVEYGWELGHEDLVDARVTLEEGQVIPDIIVEKGYDQHGTAVLGELLAVDNGYGCTGGAHGALAVVYPEYTERGARRAEAIAAAAADSRPGDIVILEMQDLARPGGSYGPAELDPDVWTVVQAATAAGVVVIAAAGNGAEDLDGEWYVDNYLAWGDSGAILVGAGSADEDRQRLYFSTYGSRVDLQGWGEAVTTLGYGDLAFLDRDPNQRYTDGFSGTSSATPIVAVAAALVQDRAWERWGAPLSPEGLRALLVQTGAPSGSPGEVGPLPDVLAALDALDADEDGFLAADWGGDDCDDGSDQAWPGNTETWYDGVDGDCLGGDDDDADGDGHAAAARGGEDCDDEDPAVHPDAVELLHNGVDDDCDPDTRDDPSALDPEDPGEGVGCCATSPRRPASWLLPALLGLLALRRRDAAGRRG